MSESFSCIGKKVSPHPLVLLHGWGFDSRIWSDIIPVLQQSFDVMTLDLPCFGNNTLCLSNIDEVAQNLLDQLPGKTILLGWSLGGLVATYIAIHFPQRVSALITVGSNLKWLAVDGVKEKWPGAAPENFAAFFENLTQNFGSTKQHFCGVIARGDTKEKQLARILREKTSDASLENSLNGLRLLDSIDNRVGFENIPVPGLHMFGERDVLVPLSAEAVIRLLNKNQQTYIFPGLSHAPFLSEPDLFVTVVKKFIDKLPYQLDKKRVAESFSKSAKTYDASAQLQCEVGDELFARLAMITQQTRQPRTVLDLGCGTGAYSQKLAQQFPLAQIVSLDIAPGMLHVAKAKMPLLAAVRADAESLPFKDNSIDVIFSNLAIQWCQHYEKLFAELQRVLIPGGYCFLSTFQEGTLRELKMAWQAVDNCVHVNEFAYAENLRTVGLDAGLFSIDMQHQSLVKYYARMKQLTQELKAIGAHNMNDGRPGGLTGKRKLKQLLEAYDQCRSNDQLPAHYEIVYLTFTKE